VSAAELRQAATLLRERAEGATTGDGATLSREWVSDLTYMSRRYEVYARDEGTVIAANLDRWSSDYIATMHPGVGLALADWLEVHARNLDGGLMIESGASPAVQLARLINGGAS